MVQERVFGPDRYYVFRDCSEAEAGGGCFASVCKIWEALGRSRGVPFCASGSVCECKLSREGWRAGNSFDCRGTCIPDGRRVHLPAWYKAELEGAIVCHGCLYTQGYGSGRNRRDSFGYGLCLRRNDFDHSRSGDCDYGSLRGLCH